MEYILFNIKKNKLEFIDKNNVLDKLYYFEHRPMTLNDIKNNKDNNINEWVDDFVKKYKNENIEIFMKKQISQIENKVPLYDIYANNIFLIDKYSVYERVTNQFYRFPNNELIKKLKKQKEEIKKHKLNDPLDIRTQKKINLMITFINYFDINLLYKTYILVFYKYSKFVGQEITTCKRESFLPQFYHIKPYFTRSEIINMARNMEMGNITDEIDELKVENLCQEIKNNEMDYTILLKHKQYMMNKESLGMVQFYTLQGSFIMNQYMRNKTFYKNQNEYLEKLIKPMWNLVLSAPEFDKKYTLYRFIKNDEYLRNLKVNDIFTENGFTSTTRDPFYKSESYQFGFILIKINVPADKKGVALCLETISHFPEEQEIIFPPQSKFKLIKKDADCVYHHTDKDFSAKVKTRYEFDWIENDEIRFTRALKPLKIEKVDFLKIEKKPKLKLIEKIKDFENNYVNEASQFNINLGNKEITVLTEWYDSTGAYNNFYAVETSSGFSLYTFYDGYILFFIEITEINNQSQMHINYYVKYSAIDPNKIIGDEKLILFYSSIAHYFDIHNVTIYANYMSCDSVAAVTVNIDKQRSENIFLENKEEYEPSVNKNIGTKLFGGSFCVDFYQYLTTNKKKYAEVNTLNVELHPEFSYYDLDLLKNISPKQILKKEDNEIYQVYNKIYQSTKNNDNVADFYIWLKESRCYLIDKLSDTIDRILGNNNPFKRAYYVLDPISYLYNRRYIQTYPSKVNIL
jgi:hypothetical protein